MNNIPCTQPVYFTASGIPAMYFRGIAINNSSIYEIPSEIATSLKRPRDVFEYLNIIIVRFGNSFARKLSHYL